MTFEERFGKRLAELRKEKGWTQKELAEKLCTGDKNLSKWERGKALPDVLFVKRIAEIFNVDINELLAEDKENKVTEKDNKLKSISDIWKLLLLISAILPLALAVIFRPFMPDIIPRQFNSPNEITVWGNNIALTVMGLIYTVLSMPFALIPSIFMGKKQGERNDKRNFYFSAIILTFTVTALIFVEIFYGITAYRYGIKAGYSVSGRPVDMESPIVLLFYWIVGSVFLFVKPNGIIGIRIPLTIKNGKNWKSIHRVVGIPLLISSFVGLTALGFINLPYKFYLPIITDTVPLFVAVSTFIICYLKIKKPANAG